MFFAPAANAAFRPSSPHTSTPIPPRRFNLQPSAAILRQHRRSSSPPSIREDGFTGGSLTGEGGGRGSEGRTAGPPYKPENGYAAVSVTISGAGKFSRRASVAWLAWARLNPTTVVETTADALRPSTSTDPDGFTFLCVSRGASETFGRPAGVSPVKLYSRPERTIGRSSMSAGVAIARAHSVHVRPWMDASRLKWNSRGWRTVRRAGYSA